MAREINARIDALFVEGPDDGAVVNAFVKKRVAIDLAKAPYLVGRNPRAAATPGRCNSSTNTSRKHRRAHAWASSSTETPSRTTSGPPSGNGSSVLVVRSTPRRRRARSSADADLAYHEISAGTNCAATGGGFSAGPT
jgi:hypothetical protein